MRSSPGILFMLVAIAGCASPNPHPAKHDAGPPEPPVCCRTEPDAGPEGCLCEPAASGIVMVNGTTCSASTTLNGQVIDFTGLVVPTCP